MRGRGNSGRTTHPKLDQKNTKTKPSDGTAPRAQGGKQEKPERPTGEKPVEAHKTTDTRDEARPEVAPNQTPPQNANSYTPTAPGKGKRFNPAKAVRRKPQKVLRKTGKSSPSKHKPSQKLGVNRTKGRQKVLEITRRSSPFQSQDSSKLELNLLIQHFPYPTYLPRVN